MSNRFGRRAQGPPTAQGPQEQYGPAQESQEQYGPRPPQGGTQEHGGSAQGQEQYVPRPSRGYEDMRQPAAAHEAMPARGLGYGHGAAILMLTGILAFLAGLAHLLNKAFFIVLPNYAYAWSTTGWGVTELVLGAVAFLAGVVALTGLIATRLFASLVAALTAIAFFLTIPYTPVWSIVVVALCVVSIYALLRQHRGQMIR